LLISPPHYHICPRLPQIKTFGSVPGLECALPNRQNFKKAT